MSGRTIRIWSNPEALDHWGFVQNTHHLDELSKLGHAYQSSARKKKSAYLVPKKLTNS